MILSQEKFAKYMLFWWACLRRIKNEKMNSLPYYDNQIPNKTDFSYNSQNIIEKHMNERLITLASILNDIQAELRHRISLKNTLVEQIDLSMCDLTTRLYQIQDLSPINSSSLNQLLMQLENLNAEKRARETEAWRDIAVLKREFRQWYKEFMAMQERAKILSQVDTNG